MKRGAGGNLTPSVSIAPVAKKIEPKIESDSDMETSDSDKKVKKIIGKPKGKGESGRKRSGKHDVTTHFATRLRFRSPATTR